MTHRRTHTQSSPLRLALVGCGAISRWHRRAIADVPSIEIAAAVDVDAARAAEAAAGTGASVYASLDAALRDGGFEAVDVMLPHGLHERAAVLVLEAGKHLLLEKPMAPTVAACERILEAVRRSGRICMVGETAQYWPAVLEAARLVSSGAIGETVGIAVQSTFPPDGEFHSPASWRMQRSEAGGGIALDAGPHFVRALRMICGEFVRVLARYGRPYADMEGESHVRAWLETKDGVMATMELLLTDGAIAPQQTLRVTGRRGEVVVDDRGVTLFAPECRNGTEVLATQPDHYFSSFRAELEDFACAVHAGRQPAASAESGLADVRIIAAMNDSAASGSWVSIGHGHSR